jgi:predicted ATPase
MAMLRRVVLNGFKSIKAMDLELRSLNVLIGANGAGKSNLVSFFKMLNEMVEGRLQLWIAQAGRAQSVLHYGPKRTQEMEAKLEFERHAGRITVNHRYHLRLFHVAGDTLAFAEEAIESTSAGGHAPSGPLMSLGSGHLESRVKHEADTGNQTVGIFQDLLGRCRVYHFHDTSPTARMRAYCYVGNDRWLMPDAGNLAAVLYRLRNQNNGSAYHPIVSTVRLIAPFFDDFDLEPSGPNKMEIILNWRERGSDQVFGPHQLSDGTLRAICLITLLMLPQDERPHFIVVDEPELGLHPYALNLVASLFKKASHHTQILISTQSSSLLDSFDPEDVVIVNREDSASQFSRPDAAKLEAWLEDYSLGEVWEKNAIAAGPH